MGPSSQKSPPSAVKPPQHALSEDIAIFLDTEVFEPLKDIKSATVLGTLVMKGNKSGQFKTWLVEELRTVAGHIRKGGIKVVAKTDLNIDGGRYCSDLKDKELKGDTFILKSSQPPREVHLQALVLHEAIHAIYDQNKAIKKKLDEETAAYTVQGIFLYRKGKRPTELQAGHPATPILEAAMMLGYMLTVQPWTNKKMTRAKAITATRKRLQDAIKGVRDDQGNYIYADYDMDNIYDGVVDPAAQPQKAPAAKGQPMGHKAAKK